MTKPEFYTVKDLAQMFQCSIDTVRRWIRCGRLECTKAGHVIRITPKQLAKFMKENKGGDEVRTTPKPRYNANGSPRYLGGNVPQPKLCPHCGEAIETTRGLVYTDQSGVYAIFENGQPNGQFFRISGQRTRDSETKATAAEAAELAALMLTDDDRAALREARQQLDQADAAGGADQ